MKKLRSDLSLVICYGWNIFYGKKNNQMVQVGNAVPPLVSYSIAKLIKKNINCPLCGLDNKINNQKLKAHYIAKCKNCSFTYSYVAPSSSELAMVYDNYDRSVNIIHEKVYFLLIIFIIPSSKNKILQDGCNYNYNKQYHRYCRGISTFI